MKREMNNKGFSLVELIIVVAIMAVLVGVLAPQYIKYLDKSKAGTDRQLADNLKQAITTTLLDPDLGTATNGAPAAGTAATDITSVDETKKFWAEVFDIMGVADGSTLVGKLKYSNGGSPAMTFEVTSTKSVKITVTYASGDAYNFTIE